MKKNIVFPIIASISLIAVSSTMAVFSNNQIKAKTRAQTYSIVLNENKNQLASDSAYFHSGTDTVTTELGNEVSFHYMNSSKSGAIKLEKSSGGHHGYFNNTTPITGMESISMTFVRDGSMQLNIQFGGSTDGTFYSEDFYVSSESPLVFDFDGKKPNFFYVSNYSEYDMIVKTVEITFSCTDSYPYLTLTSESTSKGTVSGGNKKVLAGSEVTVNAVSKSGYRFSGWYAGEDLVSSNATYTFVMPNYAYALQARFITENEWKQERGIIPTLDTENNKVIYGMYPQSRITDTALINSLNTLTSSSINSSNGFYYYNNQYYWTVNATPYESDSIPHTYFRSGNTVNAGTKYWFLCEPIVWSIKAVDGNTYTLIADEALDAIAYYGSSDNRTISGETIKPNNYMYSNIRAWLNGYDGSSYNVSNYTSNSFLKRAFGLGSSYIKTTEVDNSASTYTNSTSNTNECPNTSDKVFLACKHDIDTLYNPPQLIPTDYAAAVGAFESNSSSTRYFTRYWLRSPESGNYRTYAYCGYERGYTQRYHVTAAENCVRPMITVVL